MAGSIKIPIPWTRQPQQPVRAGHRALSRGLRLLVTGDMRRNEATDSLGTYTASSGAHSKVVIPVGIGTTGTAGAASVNYLLNAIGNGNCTVFFVGNPGSAATQNVFSQTGSAGDSWLTCNGDEGTGAGANYVSGQLALGLLQTGVSRSSIKVAGVIDGTLSGFVIRKKGTAGAAWKNGIAQTVATTGSLTGAPSAAADTVRVCGNSASGSFAYTDKLIVAGAFDRALTDKECAELSTLNGSWQLFEDEVLEIPLTDENAWYTPQIAAGGKLILQAVNRASTY